jgi:hypothetical protein
LVVLHCRLAWLLARSDDLERREALDAHLSTEGLVHLLIAVDGSNLGDTGEGFSGRLVGGLEVFAVAAPWRIEFDNLRRC